MIPKTGILLALGLLAGCAPQDNTTPEASTDTDMIYQSDFDGDLSDWVVEQQPGGRVWTEDSKLIIADEGGCSVWLKQKLEAPVEITYEIRASSQARVSDINCFWMATDPDHPDDLFDPSHGRDGSFASYDGLKTYYVGYGGNYNSTTRFRRYTGTGKRPLLPEHDLSAPEYMIEPDHTYQIRLVAADGRAQYYRDGELIFDYEDDSFLDEGWFAFRTVLSRIEVENIQIKRPE